MRHYPPASGIRNSGVNKEHIVPSRPNQLLKRARRALAQRAPQTALDLTEEAMKGSPRLVEILLIRAAALLDMGNCELALSYLETGLDLQPDNSNLLVERARVYLEMRQLTLANEDLLLLTKQFPNDPEITHLLAVLEEFSGNQEVANSLYRAAATIDPVSFPEPIRYPEADLHQMATERLNVVLQDFPDTVPEVGVQLMSLPPNELTPNEESGLSPTTLGVCMRLLLPPGSSQDTQEKVNFAPLSILLFQRNLERACRCPEDLKQLIGSTIRDELTHALGVTRTSESVRPTPIN